MRRRIALSPPQKNTIDTAVAKRMVEASAICIALGAAGQGLQQCQMSLIAASLLLDLRGVKGQK